MKLKGRYVGCRWEGWEGGRDVGRAFIVVALEVVFREMPLDLSA